MKRLFLLCSLLAIAACAPQLSPPPVATAPPPVQPAPPMTRPNTFIVFFSWNSRSVSPNGREILQQAVAAYRTGAPVTVHVTGYTDRSGSDRYNQRLSVRRVWHVAAMLLRMGVPHNDLVVSGRGENDNRVPTPNGVREPQNRVEVVEDTVMSAAFSPDGSRIVTTSWDNTARIWDAATAKEITVLRGHDNLVLSAAFSPDGFRIVTASYDRTARIWDATTGKEIAVLRGHEGLVWSAAFSPDGSSIVTASDDKTARLWNTATATEIAVLGGHEGGVISALFSPDGSRIVTVSGDTTARIWNAPTAKEIAVLHGHEGSVFSAVFSPDGSRIVTVSDDETARIWDAATGKEIAVLAVEPAPR